MFNPLTKVSVLTLCVLIVLIAVNLNAQSIVINEVMSRNDSSIADKDGEYNDWIELYNPSANPVNLHNYGLTDKADNLNKWTFPNVEIQPNEFILIFASGKNYATGELHTNFSIKGGGEHLLLTNIAGEIVDQLQAINIATNQSYGRSTDGGNDWQFFTTSTPGSTNVSGTEFNQQTAVVLNEVQAYNNTSIKDKFEEYSDWIELHNPSSIPINLSGFSLTDDVDEPQKWVFPNVNIEAGGFLLVFASGKDLKEDELHCNFEIKSSGEDIFLFDENGTFVDFVPEEQLVMDQSIGRVIDGTGDWEEFYYSTPGATNQAGNVKQKLDFSHKPGQYAEAFELDVFFEDEPNNGALSIRYTSNGAEPTINSNLYQSPINIESREGEPNYYSSSQFLTTLKFYEPSGEVYKINTIRFRVFKNGKPASKIYTKSYMIHPDFDRYTLPMLSIVSDPDDLFGGDKGIYIVGDNYDGNSENSMNCFQDGRDWERKAHFEFFMEDKAIKQNGGLRIHGGGSRRNAQKSFRLYARSEYDSENTFDYPFFEDKPIEEFKRLVLRGQAGSNFTFMTDEVVSNICRNINVHRMATRPVVVFLNGEYWGVYHIRERIDKHFLKDNFGVEEETITLLQNSPYNGGCCTEGDANEYITLMNYLSENDITNPEVYDYINQKIDLEQYATYLITEFWAANHDWPGNNIRYWKANGDYAKWQWILYDVDFGLRYHDYPSITNYLGNLTPTTDEVATELGNHLFKSEVFTNRFAEIFEELLLTTFSPQNVACEVITYSNLMLPEIKENFNRYGIPHPVSDWQNNVDMVYSNFAALRPCEIKTQIEELFDITINVDDCKLFTPGEDPCNFEVADCQNLSANIIGLPTLMPVSSSADLVGEPAGGTFSGPGVTFNKFNTVGLSPGMHIIQYTFTNQNNCTITKSQTVLVYTIEFEFVNYNLGIINPKNVGSINLSINVLKDDVFNFEIFDVNGKRIYQNQKQLSKGHHTQNFTLEGGLPKGVFLVNVGTGEYSYSKKFIN